MHARVSLRLSLTEAGGGMVILELMNERSLPTAVDAVVTDRASPFIWSTEMTQYVLSHPRQQLRTHSIAPVEVGSLRSLSHAFESAATLGPSESDRYQDLGAPIDMSYLRSTRTAGASIAIVGLIASMATASGRHLGAQPAATSNVNQPARPSSEGIKAIDDEYDQKLLALERQRLERWSTWPLGRLRPMPPSPTKDCSAWRSRAICSAMPSRPRKPY